MSDTEKTAEPTQLEKDIIRQMEYYFGDANLARDKFLQEQIGKDEGWVELTVLLTFKRLASLSADAAVIVDAVDKSEEGLLQVSEDRKKVRRHPERPLPEQNEETRKDQFERTVYLKGFPMDTTTMEALLSHFETVDKVVNVAMRKWHDKATKTYKFKGSVFVTFATKEQATAFMATEKATFGQAELVRKWRNDYMAEKKEEHASRGRKGKKEKRGEDAAAADEENTFTLPKGTLLRLENVVKETTRESIKAKMVELGVEVSYVDFSTGDEMAVVRLNKEDAAKELFAKITDAKLSLDNADVKVTLVEGDEEKELLDKAIESMRARRSNQRNHKGGRGNRGFGKYQDKRENNRKRGGSPVGKEDAPPAKTTAVAAGDA